MPKHETLKPPRSAYAGAHHLHRLELNASTQSARVCCVTHGHSNTTILTLQVPSVTHHVE